jgi:hypothetical protein
MALGERSSYCNRTEPCSSHAKLLNHDRVSTSLDSTRRQRLASMLVFFSCSTYRVCISMWAAFFDGPAKAGPGGGGRGGARVWCRKRFPLRTEYTRRNDQRTWYDQRADGERVLGRIVFMFV